MPERFGIGVAELRLNIFAVRLNCLTTYPKPLRYLSDAFASSDQGKDCKLAVAQDLQLIRYAAFAARELFDRT